MFQSFLQRFSSRHTELKGEPLNRIRVGSETIVSLFHDRLNKDMDYSPESLKSIDEAFMEMREEGVTPESAPTLLYSFGCYVGEVMVRHLNGLWIKPSRKHSSFGVTSEAILLPNEVVWNPIGKVRKLLANGMEDSVVHMYEQARQNNIRANTSKPE